MPGGLTMDVCLGFHARFQERFDDVSAVFQNAAVTTLFVEGRRPSMTLSTRQVAETKSLIVFFSIRAGKLWRYDELGAVIGWRYRPVIEDRTCAEQDVGIIGISSSGKGFSKLHEPAASKAAVINGWP